jgi:hypothetical protein
MLAKIVGFLTRNGKQLAGTDKAGNAYFRQSQTVDGAGNVVSSLTEPHGALHIVQSFQQYCFALCLSPIGSFRKNGCGWIRTRLSPQMVLLLSSTATVPPKQDAVQKKRTHSLILSFFFSTEIAIFHVASVRVF